MSHFKFNENLHGIIWMVASSVFAALMINTVRHLTESLHPFYVVFLRNFVSLIFIAPFILPHKKTVFQTKKLHLYSMRTLFGLSAMTMWFYSLSLVPLSQATALSFTAPLITSAAAILFFNEKSSRARWIALFFGFAGTIVILRPGLEGFTTASLIVLIAATFWGFNGLLIKKLSKTEPPAVIVFYMMLMMAPLSLPAAFPYLKWLSLEQIFWVCFLGVIANLFQISLSNAFSKTELTIVLPFDFLRLIFVSIIAYFAFGEKVDIYTLAGGIMILGSTVFIAYKESRSKVHIAEEAIKRANS